MPNLFTEFARSWPADQAHVLLALLVEEHEPRSFQGVGLSLHLVDCVAIQLHQLRKQDTSRFEQQENINNPNAFSDLPAQV